MKNAKFAMAAAVAMLGLIQPVRAGLTASKVGVINFDNQIVTTGNEYVSSGIGEQTVTSPGLATVSGGVLEVVNDIVQGNGGPHLPDAAINFFTQKNLYFTISQPVAKASGFPVTSPSLKSIVTIDVAPGADVSRVEGILENDLGDASSYTVSAFFKGNQVASQEFNLAANSDTAGKEAAIFRLAATSIDKVEIIPADTTTDWDYLVDTLAFNQSIEDAYKQSTAPSAVPLPPAAYAGMVMLGGLFSMHTLRSRRAAAV